MSLGSLGSSPFVGALALGRGAAVFLATTLALLPACGFSPHVHLTGRAQPRAVRAQDLIQRADVPHDHEATGTVHASCDRDERDCSELELLRVMREAAAEAGATAFIAPSCGDEQGTLAKRSLWCRATMARRRSLGTPGGALVDVAQEKRWEVRVGGRAVQVTARPTGSKRVARFEGVVARVWSSEETGAVLGTVSVECLERCQRADAERALGRGAAELGADAVAEVRCHERSADRWACTADAMRRR